METRPDFKKFICSLLEGSADRDMPITRTDILKAMEQQGFEYRDDDLVWCVKPIFHVGEVIRNKEIEDSVYTIKRITDVAYYASDEGYEPVILDIKNVNDNFEKIT